MVDRNAKFAEDVQHRGHTMDFDKDQDDILPVVPPSRSSSFTHQQHHPLAPFGAAAPNFTNPVTFSAPAPKPQAEVTEIFDFLKSVRNQSDYTELEDITLRDTKIAKPKAASGIKKWLEHVYKSSRGFELGTFDASILPIVWKKRSANWYISSDLSPQLCIFSDRTPFRCGPFLVINLQPLQDPIHKL